MNLPPGVAFLLAAVPGVLLDVIAALGRRMQQPNVIFATKPAASNPAHRPDDLRRTPPADPIASWAQDLRMT